MKPGIVFVECCIALALACAPLDAGQPATTRVVNGHAVVNWTAQSIGGASVAVPAKDAVCVLLFAMADQPRSRDAAEQLAESLKDQKGISVCVVVSGKRAEQRAAVVQSGDPLPWPVVADADYSASALFGVHVWPTTIVVNRDGAITGHLAGLPKNYRSELDAQLAVATGKIAPGDVDHLLSDHGTVADDPQQMAHRHLTLAERLLDKGLTDQAKKELDAAIALNPRAPQDKLALAKVMLAVGRSQSVAAILQSIEPNSVSPCQLNLLTGEALAAEGKWGPAVEKYTQALQLNPQPAEAYYHLGRAYEQLKDPARAAEAYRKAFEYTDQGKRLR